MMPAPIQTSPVGLRVLTVAGAVVLCLVPVLAGIVVSGGTLPPAVLTLAFAFVVGFSAWIVFRGFREGRGPEIAGGLLGVVPLVIALLAARVVHWDDFMTWLPNALSISVFGRPAFAMPEGAVPSTWGAYPPAASLAVAAVWSAFGRSLETAAGWINVAALLSLSGVIVREIGVRPTSLVVRIAAPLSAALAVTLFNPSLDWHWVLSGCPDTLTGVAVAVAAVGARRLWLDREREGEIGEAVTLGVALGLVAALKQTGLILVVLLVGATVALALLVGTPRRSLGRTLLLLVASLGPAVLVVVAWRACLALSGAAGEMGFLPFDEWHLDVLPKTLAAVGTESLDRGLRTLPELAVLGVGLVVWVRVLVARITGRPGEEKPARLNAAIFAALWVGFSSFLLVAEIGAFSAGEAERAAEWTRYQAQVAQFGLIAAAALVWETWGQRLARVPASLVGAVAAASLVLGGVASGLAGAPRPTLGLHWAGVLDAGEIGTIRTLAIRAAEEARARGADDVAFAIIKPIATPRSDQLGPWHTRSLATLIAKFQLWRSDVTRPIGFVWREPGLWRDGSDRVLIDIGGRDGSVVWVKENGDWRAVLRMADPPSLTPVVPVNPG